MAENELFGDEPASSGNNSNGNGNGANAPKPPAKKAKIVSVPAPAAVSAAPVSSAPASSAVMEAAEEPLTDPFAGSSGGETVSAESSSEPAGAAPLMAAPTSPDVYAAPVLPERISDARDNGGGPELFAGEGLTFERKYTKEGQDVFDTVEWELRTAVISGDKGEVVFEQKDCEIPSEWSMLATNVVVSKYFRGKVGTPQRERSVKQLISRVADTIYNWGKQGNYFATDKDADIFHDELRYLLLHQHMAFNSPVWFNLGVPGERPQVSACQPYDALVSTPQGLLPIGKLVENNAVGTVIYDAHGTTRIVATKANGRKEVLRIHTKSGYALDVTGDHLVWSETAGDFVPAQALAPGHELSWCDTASGSDDNVFGAEKGFCAFLRPVKSIQIDRIEPLGEMEVYDIQTESGEYLSGNIRVHNCFINKVEDTMESILTLAKTEGMLFKWGSGTGTNVSVLRSSKEGLKGGGTASGPVSFMRGFDAFAGAIKCLTPDALVHTDKGMQTLGEIIDPALGPGFHPNTSVVLATKNGPTRISHVYVSPEAQTFRLRLQHTNLSLRGTADHPVLTLTPDFTLQWKKLPDLRRGDRVAVSRRTEMWPQSAPSFADFAPVSRYAKKTLSYPVQMTPELARLLGYMVSEGCMDSERFRFCNADTDTFADFLHCVRTVFGVDDVSRNVSVRTHSETGVSTQIFEACWTNAVRFLQHVGLTSEKSADKTLPWSVRYSPRPLVAEFMRAYFEGDGHVSSHVYAASASEELLREIQLLLLNMGMVGLLRPHPVNGKQYWSLYLRGEAAWQFVREIGFVSRRKNEMANFATGDKNTNIDTVPFLADVLRTRTQKNGYFRCADKQTRFVGFGFFNRRPNSGISYNRLRATPQLADKLRVVDAALADTLETVMEREFFWDSVGEVTEAEAAVTYDFTVPGTHSFVANGIINHNSGGKTRRAAKMTILNADHPDIEDFIECKADAEKKAHALIEAGYSGAFNVPNGAYDSVFFQNANHSVRATDEFMRAVELDRDWTTAAVTTGEPMETLRARDLMHKIAQATWVCGDPGMQFDTTANKWHTCPNTDRINASNPCCFVGETMVNTTNGLLRFDELEQRSGRGETLPFVPSWDKKANAPVLRAVKKVWVAGYTNTLFEVATEAGIVVRCTPEHRFLTHDNEYVPASELAPGTRLRQLARFAFGGKNENAGGEMPRPFDTVVSSQAVFLPDAVPVYDLEVDDTHNFGVVQKGFAGHSSLAVSNSEFFFLDDTACNLASLNLMRFRTDDREFDIEAFRHAVRVTVSAMEIMVGFAAYPTDKITVNSFDYRPLGLGYANLGALLMARGLPYDSNEGRAYAGAITAVLSGEGYTQSAKMAARVGPFAGYEKNKAPMLRVMQMHRDHVEALDKDFVPPAMLEAARTTWDAAIEKGRESGFRNSQISVLAPTGCLVPGSLVITDKGVLRLDRLGNVSGEKSQSVDFRVLTDTGEQVADKFFVNGSDWTRRIVTKAGYAIEGTLKHRIKVVDTTGAWTWKRFADLVPGDVTPLSMGQLAGVPQTVSLPPLGEEYWTDERRLRGDYTTTAPRTMTPDLAELIGYFMGDGSLHSKGPRFCVANTDADVAARVAHLVKSLFNVTAHITEQSGYCEVAVHSVPLALWWEACGFVKRLPNETHTGKGYTPHIPDAVLASNDKAVYGAFLRGLFEADGTVTGGVPCWTTVKRSFSEEVKTLLLALGLPTVSDTTQTGWGNSTAYRLRLRNSGYAEPFRAAVGFMGRRKADAVTRAQGEQTARHDYIYLGRELVDELIPASHPLRNAATLAMRRHNGAITRRTANALLAETGDNRLAHALGFFYDTIAANEDAGMQPTFDLSVPENLTYVAQGFVSHNTIGFLMDCDTTGVEPDIAIVKYKSLVGGGMFKIVNQTVPEALTRLGYSASERKAILSFIEQHDTIEGAPGLAEAHLPVFDCAFRAKNGTRTIHYMGHIQMMSAVQPFISGAISKTANMPHDATPEDIGEAYLQAWKLGIKALAIYRDGSKKTQPLSTGKADETKTPEAIPAMEARPLRRRLPDERQALTHKFSVGGHEGYITIGLYPDQTPGEIFITMSKEGSVVSGLMDAFATSISLALQYGVPLRTLVEKFMHSRFEPSGFTGNPQIPMAKSIMDYLFRYIALKFLDKDERANVGLIADAQDDYDGGGQNGSVGTGLSAPPATAPTNPVAAAQNGAASATGTPGQAGPQGTPAPSGQTRTQAAEREVFVTQADAPPCPECGSITTRNGACYRCNNCGTSIGCS